MALYRSVGRRSQLISLCTCLCGHRPSLRTHTNIYTCLHPWLCTRLRTCPDTGMAALCTVVMYRLGSYALCSYALCSYGLYVVMPYVVMAYVVLAYVVTAHMSRHRYGGPNGSSGPVGAGNGEHWAHDPRHDPHTAGGPPGAAYGLNGGVAPMHGGAGPQHIMPGPAGPAQLKPNRWHSARPEQGYQYPIVRATSRWT